MIRWLQNSFWGYKFGLCHYWLSGCTGWLRWSNGGININLVDSHPQSLYSFIHIITRRTSWHLTNEGKYVLFGCQDMIERKFKERCYHQEVNCGKTWIDNHTTVRSIVSWAGFWCWFSSRNVEVNSTLHTWDWHSCLRSNLLHAFPFFASIWYSLQCGSVFMSDEFRGLRSALSALTSHPDIQKDHYYSWFSSVTLILLNWNSTGSQLTSISRVVSPGRGTYSGVPWGLGNSANLW